jgi:oligogalacturonide transport system permease protein
MYTNRAVGLAYVSPFLIGLALFLLFPFLASLGLSFTDYRLQDRWSDAHFIGTSNYMEIFADYTFR